MFVEDINRKINGVVKVDEDENKVLEQELNEYVITRELKRHFADFFNTYAEAFDEPTADTGVWISGFFGSGKSHFLKMLSYLLENKEVNGVRTVERFRKKFEDDPGTFMQVDRATKGETETILFNIDYEGSINKDKTAVLRVFAKVFYNHLGFFGSNLKVAMLEQYITQQGKMDEFCRLIEEKKGKPWTEVRKAFAFNGKFIKPALAEALDISEEDANNWFNDKSATELSVSQLVEDINAYVSTKPANFRLLFMVDEAGQYVGTDTDMLLNLQSLVEKIGSECRGKVWVVCTGQEAIDEIIKVRADEFSRIQARFKTRLSLSSSSVDEVIQKRILKKTPEAERTLDAVYEKESSGMRNLFSFTNAMPDIKGFSGPAQFAEDFPFVPYQFLIMQKIFVEIRKHGNAGKHFSGGERSMLSGFQEAAQKVEKQNEFALVPLFRFYDTVHSFLDGSIRNVIDRCSKAVENHDGLEPMDVDVLKLLYLIRYVNEDMPANLDNLVILMADDIRLEKVAMREKLRGSLDRLIGQNYIGRTGDTYNFLTDEEQDIQKEINRTQVDTGAIVGDIAKIIFGIIYDAKKFRYGKCDFPFDQMVDNTMYGISTGGMRLRFLTAASDATEKTEFRLMNSSKGSEAIVVLGDTPYYESLEASMKIRKYVKQRNVSQMPKSAQDIIRDQQEEATKYEAEASKALVEAIENAKFYADGEHLDIKSGNAKAKIDQTMEYNEFSKEPTFSPALFEPYFQNYESWRDQALTLAQKCMQQDDVLIFTLDFKRYYYSVDVSEEFMKEILTGVKGKSDYNEEYLSRINDFVYCVIKRYSQIYKEHSGEEWIRRILPIGFLPSGVLANECLKKFDTAILDGWNPLYYGRYVDDILLVEKVEEGSRIAQKAQDGKLEFYEAFEYYTVNNSRWTGKENRNARAVFKKEEDECGTYCILPEFTKPLGSATKIQLQASKIKLFYFQRGQSDALITCFKNSIEKNKSEFRWMPEDDAVFQEDDYSEVFELSHHGVNKLREVDDIAVDKYALSKYLGKLQRINGLISEKTKGEEYNFVRDIHKIFTPKTIIENYTLWERVIAILFVKKSYKALLRFIALVIDTLDKTSYAIEGVDDDTGFVTNALREALQEHLISSIARPMALHDGETFEEWKLEDAQSLLSEQMKELLTKAQNRSKGYFKAKMLDKNLCVIWPELVSCGGENPQKKDLTNEDNVVELLKKETCTETFQEKMNKIINQRYIYYPYLIKPADLMLARLMYDLVRKKDLEDLNKIEEIFKQCWQLNYSPLPFEGWTNNRFIEENIKTGELNKQPVFQIGKPSFSKIRVAVANIQMDISNFDQAVMRKPNRSYRRYQQIAELVNTAVREKADMLVMPEACTPKEWLPTLARTCEKNHLAVVTGVEHIIEDNCVYNLTAVILPYEEKWTGQWHSVILYHSKNHFAPEEKRMIESLHLRAMEGIESSEAKCDAKYELYSWNGFWFTVYCCFELTSIRDRSIFQSYIDAVIAVEWNHDVNYYSNIIESLSRDIHCYCIQTNTSEYGDSRITKPSKTENKDILRIKGGSNATAHVGTIDLEQLREFQMKAYSGQKEDKTFKPTPPDFDYKGAYERRKGTMFECFCAKKKAD